MTRLSISDLLHAGPGGQAICEVAGFPATIALPNNFRDWHAMSAFRRWGVGQMTSGLTMNDGIHLNLKAMSLATPENRVRTIVHEACGHWWRIWKIMGPGDWLPTYAWQAILTFGMKGSAHAYAGNPEEVFANAVEDQIIAEIKERLRETSFVTFDAAAWCQAHYPAKR